MNNGDIVVRAIGKNHAWVYRAGEKPHSAPAFDPTLLHHPVKKGGIVGPLI